MVSASLDLAGLNEQAAKMRLSPDATFRVIDQKGTILARYPDQEKWVGQSLPEAGIIKTILNQHEGTTEAPGVDNVTRIFAFAPVHSGSAETGIFVSIGIPSSTAFAQINRTLVRDLTELGIVILLLLVITWFGTDAFVLRHLNALVDAAWRLGAGEQKNRCEKARNDSELPSSIRQAACA